MKKYLKIKNTFIERKNKLYGISARMDVIETKAGESRA